MRRAILLVPALAMLLAVAAAQTPRASGPASRPAASWDDYRIIVDRNIFSRDRYVPVAREPRVFTPQPPRVRAEQSFLLTGVTFSSDVWEAFFEDNRTGEMRRVSTGDSLGEGRIASIAIDGVVYRAGSASRRLSIGQDLSGEAGTAYSSSSGLAPAPSPAALQPTTEATSQPSADNEGPPAAGGDVLERMRQRRLQELNK